MVAHGKPLIYVSRPLFCEQEGLLSNLMFPFGRCLEMPMDDFQSGNWAKYINQVFKLPFPQKKIALNGHEVIVNTLENIYETSQKGQAKI